MTVYRIYKDGDTWSEPNSFGRDDLLIVAKVLDRYRTGSTPRTAVEWSAMLRTVVKMARSIVQSEIPFDAAILKGIAPI